MTSAHTHQLISQQENGLQAELAIAEVEQIFERRAQKVKHHGVVVALSAEPPDKWHTNATSESLIDLGLIFKLRVLGFDRLELDGDLFTGNDVDSQVNVTYGNGLGRTGVDGRNCALTERS